MTFTRRAVAVAASTALVLGAAVPSALAQAKKDQLTLAMTLEPPGLDPTAGAASAIAEIVQYNVFETLTKIGSDSKITPLLAESWTVSPDLKTWTFKLRSGVRFQNGEPFSSASVRFSWSQIPVPAVSGARATCTSDVSTVMTVWLSIW